MKKILLLLFILLSINSFSQSVDEYLVRARYELKSDNTLLLKRLDGSYDTIPILSNPTNGQVFKYLNGNWINSDLQVFDSVSFNILDGFLRFYQEETVIDSTSLDGRYLKNPIDSLQLNPNIPQVDENPTAYTLWADSLTKLIAFQRGYGNLDYINSTISIPFVNTTGGTLTKGTPVSASQINTTFGRNLPSVAVTDITDIKSARAFAGLVRDDVENGKIGIIQRLNYLLGLNTASFSVQDAVYVGSGGTITNVAPSAPDYIVYVGRVVISDAVNGIIEVVATPFVGNDTETNFQGAINGFGVYAPEIRDTVISNVLYVEVRNQTFISRDLPYMYDNMRYNLNTTTGSGTDGWARVALDWGTDTIPLKQYVYIDHNSGSPILAKSNTSYPVDGIRIASYSVRSQSKHELYGFAGVRRVNNEVDVSNANGIFNKVVKKIRNLGSKILSGVDPTVTLSTEVTIDSLKVTSTSGIGEQLNEQIINALKGPYIWFNPPSGIDSVITDLNQIGVDAEGNSIRINNSRYRLTFFVIINSSTYDCKIGVNVSRTGFANDDAVIGDPDRLSVTTPPSDIEDICVRWIGLPLRYTTANGGTLINLLGAGGFQDETNYPFGTSASGTSTGAAKNVYTDSEFQIVNLTDPTKIAQFDASNITTGTTKPLTIPDVSDTIAVKGVDNGFSSDQTFKYDINVNDSIKGGSLTIESNLDVAQGVLFRRDTGTMRQAIESYSDLQSTNSSIYLRRFRGSKSSPTSLQEIDHLGKILFQGYSFDKNRIAGGFIMDAYTDFGVGSNSNNAEGVLRLLINGYGQSAQENRVLFYYDSTKFLNKVYMDSLNLSSIVFDRANLSTPILAKRDTGSIKISLQSYNDLVTTNSTLQLNRARGSLSSPTPLLENDLIGKIEFKGYDDGFGNSASIFAFADKDHGDTSTDSPGRIEFWVAPDGSSTLEKAVTIFSNKSQQNQGKLILKSIPNSLISTNKFIVSDSDTLKYRTGTELASDIGALTEDGIFLPSLAGDIGSGISFRETNTGIFSNTTNSLRAQIGGSVQFEITATAVKSFATNGWSLSRVSPSATNPAYGFKGDENTGGGREGDDIYNLIAGGITGIKIKEESLNIELGFKGSINKEVTSVNSSTYDLAGGDYTLKVDYTSTGEVTSLTLLTAQSVEGREIVIKDTGGNAGTNNITIDTEGSELIDGASTLVLNTNYASVILQFDGTNWMILSIKN